MEETKVIHKTKVIAPKLRFRDYSDTWETKLIGDLGNFIGGGTPTTNVEKYWGGKIPWISSSDLFEDDIHNINIHRFITNEAIEESATKIIPKNSVLLISRVGVGKLAINKEEICTSQDFSNFIPIKCNSFYIGYFLTARKSLLINFSQGTSIKGFTTSDIKSLKISIPSLQEQQKIASFLSSVDEKIQLLNRKKQLLEQYKKGVMQQLFTGKLRFKDENGKAYPKWEEKKLGDVFEFFRGSPISKSDLSESGKYLCIHYGELFTSYSEVINSIKSKTDLENGFFSIKGDILMPSSDVTPKGLAKASSIQIDKVILGGDMNILRPKFNYDSIFFSYLLNFNQQKIIQKVTGTTVKHIYNRDVKLLEFNIPKSFEEQKKIADFLSAIDVKIESLSEQINQTQNFKKGLLQQMFV
jgi:type I restriction enzyme S subunit